MVFFFHCPENSIFIYPRLGCKFFVFFCLFKIFKGFPEIRLLAFSYSPIIHLKRTFSEFFWLLFQKTILIHFFQTDICFVSCTGRIGLIRRISKSHRRQRKYLPDRYPCIFKLIDKCNRIFSQFSDSAFGRKRRYRHQYSRFSHLPLLSKLSSFSSALYTRSISPTLQACAKQPLERSGFCPS